MDSNEICRASDGGGGALSQVDSDKGFALLLLSRLTSGLGPYGKTNGLGEKKKKKSRRILLIRVCYL